MRKLLVAVEVEIPDEGESLAGLVTILENEIKESVGEVDGCVSNAVLFEAVKDKIVRELQSNFEYDKVPIEVLWAKAYKI